MIESATRRSDSGLLLVLDQFEEFIILGSDEAKSAFANMIADLRKERIAKFTLLLVLRSDYQTFLEETGLPPPRYGENLFQVGRFTLPAAGEFLSCSPLDLQREAIDRLVASAAELDETPGLVRPITLNVVGHVLASGNAVAPSLHAGELVDRYIAQTITQPALRDLARPVLEQLITEQSTKRPRSEEELAEATDLRRGEVRAVLNGLAAAALVRPLDRTAAIWELSHDFIARAVARHLGHTRRDTLRRAVTYAAPALLATALLGTAGAVGFEYLVPYHLRAELAELGLTVTPSGDGMAVERNSLLKLENFGKTGPHLQRFRNVRSLDLSGTQVANLEPLKGLSSLQSLNLERTQVANLEPLKGLSSLQSLNLERTQVANLEPLKGLSSLQSLNLWGTQVANLEPLKGLSSSLQSLNLSGTQVANLEPLKGLSSLQSLNLWETQVVNLEPLKGLSSLQSLNLSGTQVANLEPLKGLSSLQPLSSPLTKSGLVDSLKAEGTDRNSWNVDGARGRSARRSDRDLGGAAALTRACVLRPASGSANRGRF